MLEPFVISKEQKHGIKVWGLVLRAARLLLALAALG